ncbi:MAG: hypothetical protein WCR51_08005 [Planctomycetia bacterium]
MPAADPRPPLTLTVAGVMVRFVWRDDRWAHEVVDADGTCWRSIEGVEAGAGDPRWPASPALVELSRLGTAPGSAILGVGLAGRSHFSASVGPDPAHPDRLRFDIACRVNEPPIWLGSTYHGPGGRVRIGPGAAAERPPATVQWGYVFASGGIRPLAGSRVEAAAD